MYSLFILSHLIFNSAQWDGQKKKKTISIFPLTKHHLEELRELLSSDIPEPKGSFLSSVFSTRPCSWGAVTPSVCCPVDRGAFLVERLVPALSTPPGKHWGSWFKENREEVISRHGHSHFKRAGPGAPLSSQDVPQQTWIGTVSLLF